MFENGVQENVGTEERSNRKIWEELITYFPFSSF
jgi:hypothetical protein